MSGSTLDDPLFERYMKLNCSLSPLEKEEDDYKMIVKYLDKTYEPVSIADVVRSFHSVSIRQVHFGYRFITKYL